MKLRISLKKFFIVSSLLGMNFVFANQVPETPAMNSGAESTVIKVCNCARSGGVPDANGGCAPLPATQVPNQGKDIQRHPASHN